MKHRKLSQDNMSDLKIKDVILPRSVLVTFETLQSFYDTFMDYPDELKNKIHDLLFWIDEKYFFMPDSEFGCEIINDNYKIVYEYKEFLS